MTAEAEEAIWDAARQKLTERLQRMREEIPIADPPPAKPPLEAFDEWADWIVRLRPLRSFAAPPTARMKRLLKAALRQFGFRAEEVRQATDGPRKPTKSDT